MSENIAVAIRIAPMAKIRNRSWSGGGVSGPMNMRNDPQRVQQLATIVATRRQRRGSPRTADSDLSKDENNVVMGSLRCARKLLQAFFDEEEDQVLDAAGVAPFVVVPGDDLAGVAADYLGEERVHDGGEWVALEVGADKLFGGEAEDALEFAFRGLLECFVDAGRGNRLLGDEGEVDDGDVGGRYADGETVQLAVHLRDDELEGLGGAGGAWDHGKSSGAGTAEILVRGVEDNLVVGVAVDCRHDARRDAEGVVQDVNDRCEAVGGAGGVGDDVVFGGVVFGVVDAQDEGDVLVGGGSGDNDLFNRFAEVGLGLGGVGEETSGFNDDLRAYGGPVELGGIALCEDLDFFAVDDEGIFGVGDFVLQVAEDGVVLEEMSERGGRGEVIYGDEFNLGIAEGGAEDITSDAAETVDTYFDCHVRLLLKVCCEGFDLTCGSVPNTEATKWS